MRRALAPSLVLLLAGFLAAFAPGALSQGSEPSPPRNLEQALERLDQILSESSKEELKALPEREAAVRAHRGLGMYLRNNWGLWAGSPLATYFRGLGVEHPDDMSSIILTSYWRRLNARPIELDNQVACYKRWRQEQPRLIREAESRGKSSHAVPQLSCP